jgi:hypothetical protein
MFAAALLSKNNALLPVFTYSSGNVFACYYPFVVLTLQLIFSRPHFLFHACERHFISRSIFWAYIKQCLCITKQTLFYAFNHTGVYIYHHGIIVFL